MQKEINDIIIFLIIVTLLIIGLASLITFMFVTYRKKQNIFHNNLEQLKLDHEKTLLSTQLEIQEQTFEHIAREIHDNINLSLTLAKLNLNTIDFKDEIKTSFKIESSVNLLSKSIADLSNISKGLNAELIFQQGLLQSIEDEIMRIRQVGTFFINYSILGNPIFLNAQKELIIFRIIQEAFNNVIKHAKAQSSTLFLNYEDTHLKITLFDDGVGFDSTIPNTIDHAGLKNMESRTKFLGGSMKINSEIGKGTVLNFLIPYKLNGK